MGESTTKEKSKFNLFNKIIGYLAIILMFIIFFIDRTLHIILPHREHPQFTVWAKDITNVKYAFARLVIFSLPIFIFKVISWNL